MNNKETLTIEKKKKPFHSLKIIDNLNKNKKKVVHTHNMVYRKIWATKVDLALKSQLILLP